MRAALRTTRQRRRFSLPAAGAAGLPIVVLRRVAALVRRLIRDLPSRSRDRNTATYLAGSQEKFPLNQFLRGICACAPNDSGHAAVAYFMDHRFDILGSGWTRVVHGITCRGLEGIRFPPAAATDLNTGEWLRKRVTSANLPESMRIWSLIDAGYRPIDWHLDFKSGFRWDEKTWYHDIRFGAVRGADVKVPWELSRLQHLPQIAIEYGIQRSLALTAEIRNQLLDWIASNPPRFGVNWFSTMDVSIRVANMLVAYDLALAYGAKFDAEFTLIFQRSIIEHARHIVANLEWNADFRGNHYLANISGLFFAAAYLDDRVAEKAGWIQFCQAELITAVEEQFCEDGGNFEASTSYHRLSAEMVMYCTALARRLGQGSDPFPDWYYARLERMGDLTAWMQKPDGRVVQVGDNDSGRFLKLAPRRFTLTCAEAKAVHASLGGYSELPGTAPYPDEITLDHRHLLAGLSGLFDRSDFAVAAATDAFERMFCCALAGSTPPRNAGKARGSFMPKKTDPSSNDSPQVRHVIQVGAAFRSNDARAFEGFGAFVIKGDNAHLAIRCGTIGQNGIGGHAHNDQLSFELTVPGATYWKDPGTYLYTPLPARRNEYRSVFAHNGPRPQESETGYFGAGLFRIVDAWEGECLTFSPHTFLGVIHQRSSRIFRRITLGDSKIIVEDWAIGCTLSRRESAPTPVESVAFSPGYGVLERVAE